MKKQRFSSAIIFLLAITFVLFCNISQVKAQCNIVWWGVESGSVPTDETLVTETATSEAFNAIFGFAPHSCIGNIPSAEYVGYVCGFVNDLDLGLFSEVFLDWKCWSSPTSPVLDNGFSIVSPFNNGWDVVCTELCETSGGDSDIDAICDNVDNCPNISNPGQEDFDNDTIGDDCDDCPNDADNDIDSDGICGDVDNCPNISNPGQEDFDNDTIGDDCDNCPEDCNTQQLDADNDTIGDVCDPSAGCGGCGKPRCEQECTSP
jgi:hypothetical protein